MVFTYGIVTDGGGNKIRGYHRRSLVKQLVKGMLAVGSRFSPNDRPCGVSNLFATPVHVFSIAFHISLLEVSRETMHILVVRQNRFRLGAKEINIPKAHQAHDNRNIFFKLFLPEMFVGFISAF